MSEKIPPIVTGKNYQILSAKKKGDTWTVEVRLGGKKRTIEVIGSEEDVLSEVEAQSGGDRTKVDPTILKIFKQNLGD